MPRRHRPVSSRAILDADLLVRGAGVRRSLRRLEAAEPHLAGYVMETATRLHARLDRAGCNPRAARAIQARAVVLALTVAEAIRRSPT